MGTAREPPRERLSRPDSACVRHPLNEGMGRPTRPQKRSLLYVFHLSHSLTPNTPSPPTHISTRMAPCPPNPRLRRFRRRHPTLGPLLPNSRHALRPTNTSHARTRTPPQQSPPDQPHPTLRRSHRTSPTSPPTRDALPSTRLERLGTSLPPFRAPTRLSFQRPHDAFLGTRAARRRSVLFRARWRQASSCTARR